jgi:hypothetical protein
MNKIQIVNETSACETSAYTWVTEASTLGLAPGSVPLTLETTLGNGQPFNFVGSEGGSDCMTKFHYLQGNGCISLVVFND